MPDHGGQRRCIFHQEGSDQEEPFPFNVQAGVRREEVSNAEENNQWALGQILFECTHGTDPGEFSEMSLSGKHRPGNVGLLHLWMFKHAMGELLFEQATIIDSMFDAVKQMMLMLAPGGP